MKCLTPIWIEETSDVKGTYVPCGRCVNCLETKRSVWTFRLLMELRVAESAHFVTLTYDPLNVPYVQNDDQLVMSLRKKDIQDFIRDLRNYIVRNRPKVDSRHSGVYDDVFRWLKISPSTGLFSPKLRYFLCGEYGTKNTKRPHYHIIMYNCPNQYFKDDPIHGYQYSPILEKIWNKGNIKVGAVERGSAHYMTKYHMFPIEEWFKDSDNRERPFATMSRRPGIGINYIDDKITDYYSRTKNSYATLKNGIKQPLGRYYKDKIKENIEDEEVIREMQRRSIEFIEQTEQEKWERSVEEHDGDIIEAERDLHRKSAEEYRVRTKQVRNRLKKHGKL